MPHFNNPSPGEAIGVILLGLIALAAIIFFLGMCAFVLYSIWKPLPFIVGAFTAGAWLKG
ncbi:hypothetical protein D3C80_820920 [compost metagenome]